LRGQARERFSLRARHVNPAIDKQLEPAKFGPTGYPGEWFARQPPLNE
jgi:hypothetical protein